MIPLSIRDFSHVTETGEANLATFADRLSLQETSGDRAHQTGIDQG